MHIEELENCIILKHICNELFLQIKNIDLPQCGFNMYIAPNPSPCKTSGNPPKNSPIYHKQNFGIVAQTKTLEVAICWKQFWVDSFDFLAFALAVVREADLGGSVRPSLHQLVEVAVKRQTPFLGSATCTSLQALVSISAKSFASSLE